MPFLLLLLLLLITLHEAWPNPFAFGPAGSCFFTWAGVLLLTLLSAFASLLTCRALRRDPEQRGAVMARYGRWKRWHGFALFGFFVIALYGFGWGWTVQQTEAELPVPGLRVLILAPLFVGLVLGWMRQYDAERQNYDIAHYPHTAPFLGRWAYLGLQVRHHLLFVLPPIVLLIAHESLFLAAPDLKESKNSVLVALAGVVLLLLALVFIPLLLRLLLGLKSMPDGPMRQRLLATARRLRFRFSDVLVWDTRNGIANAMVTGVVPWLRYVVVTDRLLEDLNEDEVEAVFGHEVGHMKHHHMAFYMVFILTSMMLLGGLWKVGDWWMQQYELPDWLSSPDGVVAWHALATWIVLAVVAVYVLVVFGWLSRRCERQADIYGCKTASPAAFVNALEKVAELNGISRERPGFLSWWQHSTIADRIDFIRRMESDPTLEPRFQRRLRWLKWGVAVGLIALLIVLRQQWDWDLMKLL